jgi:hypothetical protein
MDGYGGIPIVEPRVKVVNITTAIVVVTKERGEDISASQRLASPYAIAPRSLPRHTATTMSVDGVQPTNH